MLFGKERLDSRDKYVYSFPARLLLSYLFVNVALDQFSLGTSQYVGGFYCFFVVLALWVRNVILTKGSTYLCALTTVYWSLPLQYEHVQSLLTITLHGVI